MLCLALLCGVGIFVAAIVRWALSITFAQVFAVAHFAGLALLAVAASVALNYLLGKAFRWAERYRKDC